MNKLTIFGGRLNGRLELMRNSLNQKIKEGKIPYIACPDQATAERYKKLWPELAQYVKVPPMARPGEVFICGGG